MLVPVLTFPRVPPCAGRDSADQLLLPIDGYRQKQKICLVLSLFSPPQLPFFHLHLLLPRATVLTVHSCGSTSILEGGHMHSSDLVSTWSSVRRRSFWPPIVFSYLSLLSLGIDHIFWKESKKTDRACFVPPSPARIDLLFSAPVHQQILCLPCGSFFSFTDFLTSFNLLLLSNC